MNRNTVIHAFTCERLAEIDCDSGTFVVSGGIYLDVCPPDVIDAKACCYKSSSDKVLDHTFAAERVSPDLYLWGTTLVTVCVRGDVDRGARDERRGTRVEGREGEASVEMMVCGRGDVERAARDEGREGEASVEKVGVSVL